MIHPSPAADNGAARTPRSDADRSPPRRRVSPRRPYDYDNATIYRDDPPNDEPIQSPSCERQQNVNGDDQPGVKDIPLPLRRCLRDRNWLSVGESGSRSGMPEHMAEPSAAARPAGSGERPIISQRDLSRYQNLAAARRDYETLRERLLALYESGAVIEPGAYSLRVKQGYRKCASRQKLVDLLGQREAEDLLSKIAPTLTRTIQIESGGWEPASWNA